MAALLLHLGEGPETTYGISQNAVKAQSWIAVCVYVPVAIPKKRLAFGHSLLRISTVENLFLRLDRNTLPKLGFDW
ncbi:MAG: hypothetical protein KJ052_22220 [Candidatus Hydrogenedentes bacterium]|nr:hypothetical protein [Candidatus Hydrogenedentota bacterium]